MVPLKLVATDYDTIIMIVLGLLGVVVGYAVTRYATKSKEKDTESYKIVMSGKKKDIINTGEKEMVEPSDFNELVNYLKNKYILSEVTLATTDGFPIASTSQDAEIISALAPEILKRVGKIVESKEVVISGRDFKLGVFEINEDVIGFIKANRDIHFIEIDRIKEDVNRFMGVTS
ncbi:hypothetical protein [Archaeoglobus sp.]